MLDNEERKNAERDGIRNDMPKVDMHQGRAENASDFDRTAWHNPAGSKFAKEVAGCVDEPHEDHKTQSDRQIARYLFHAYPLSTISSHTNPLKAFCQRQPLKILL